MGFIERLKTELESKEQEEFQRRQQYAAQLEADQEKQRQLAVQAEALHKQRHKAATDFFQESHVENMLERLASVISGSVVGVINGDQYFQTDPDSKVIRIRWEAIKIGKDGGPDGISYWATWDILKAKSFTVECDCGGTLHFKGGLFSGSRITVKEWRNNTNVLDSALEKAYSHPGTFRYTGNRQSQYLDCGS
ncbi:MAG: hypothetical protein A3D24_04570 [Candidatus Blackburnbacteria bacterium RIFCSPHIGHO2_02_FULL_39_13]|uniref:Uncharacterized protein n=1 Tax=Candidatus Blackburnbacteria bacterium RIFCSPLOWO2_01_FULL_40_20 TaxID=1797519 RepID=A0A1G1VF78_9BACT|nr:MAG: hypothetical protein A2694_03215 [Candidatus Blackburnbacteria bacterium RIFCSPHIGHO2_01_FULL_40_17]OGY09700.1 MAG: hypothetical protein A3D24_04570 [Candidatus Blackburnbacteria bacterium RIFCSPHIGHO2_02_FULL_39_13]OGY13987.1 MAG: hypothetical protein A3A77_02795 [Candidatus Blackburnbacteria bacterium RIFCSPLOWO2_01_FULL_40_20]OGY15535.1 MAG: hypothetical protein A3I52_00965 [Candidatus Blackburnbacteria bacterium RIFCSPLOWO2_02_FULL_40_10]HBL52010.1 hypothetical protein [Candidatus B